MSCYICMRCEQLRDADEEDSTLEYPDGLLCEPCQEELGIGEYDENLI